MCHIQIRWRSAAVCSKKKCITIINIVLSSKLCVSFETAHWYYFIGRHLLSARSLFFFYILLLVTLNHGAWVKDCGYQMWLIERGKTWQIVVIMQILSVHICTCYCFELGFFFLLPSFLAQSLASRLLLRVWVLFRHRLRQFCFL